MKAQNHIELEAAAKKSDTLEKKVLALMKFLEAERLKTYDLEAKLKVKAVNDDKDLKEQWTKPMA